MLFKNVTVMKIKGDMPLTQDLLREALEKNPFVPARDMESERFGWVSPDPNAIEESLIKSFDSAHLMNLKIQTKILPSSVIKEELAERIEMRHGKGQKASAKERRQLMDEIRFDLLPKAFSKFTHVTGYIDAQRRELIIGSASSGHIDYFVNCLRTSLGSLPVVLLEAEDLPQVTMTEWARRQEAPAKVQFGQEISLVDPADGGQGTFRNQDLLSEEIIQCLDAGKRVKRLSLAWNDYLSFSVDDRLTLRKLTPLDSFQDSHDEDDARSALDADYVMTVAALRKLLPELYEWFAVKRIEVTFEGWTNNDGGDEYDEAEPSQETPDEELEIAI